MKRTSESSTNPLTSSAKPKKLNTACRLIIFLTGFLNLENFCAGINPRNGRVRRCHTALDEANVYTKVLQNEVQKMKGSDCPSLAPNSKKLKKLNKFQEVLVSQIFLEIQGHIFTNKWNMTPQGIFAMQLILLSSEFFMLMLLFAKLVEKLFNRAFTSRYFPER